MWEQSNCPRSSRAFAYAAKGESHEPTRIHSAGNRIAGGRRPDGTRIPFARAKPTGAATGHLRPTAAQEPRTANRRRRNAAAASPRRAAQAERTEGGTVAAAHD